MKRNKHDVQNCSTIHSSKSGRWRPKQQQTTSEDRDGNARAVEATERSKTCTEGTVARTRVKGNVDKDDTRKGSNEPHMSDAGKRKSRRKGKKDSGKKIMQGVEAGKGERKR